MPSIAYKPGVLLALCGAALAFVCTATQAQDNNRNVAPVDASLHADVKGIDEQPKEPPVPAKTEIHPLMFSSWSSRTVKQPPPATVWVGQSSAANAKLTTAGDSMSVPNPLKRPPTPTTWRGQFDGKAPVLESNANSHTFSGRFQRSNSLAVQTQGDRSAGPEIFPNLSKFTLSKI